MDEQTRKRIQDLIDESHFRTLGKVVPYVKDRFPEATRAQVETVLNTLPKDMSKKSQDVNKHYLAPIFTPYMGGYQMDLLQQSNTRNSQYPHYFLIAINVNSRYGYAYPVDSKSASALLPVIQRWVGDVEAKGQHVLQITADEESAWADDKSSIKKWLTQKEIHLTLINSKQHSALGMVDRFIRTLRGMLARYPGEPRDFTIEQMAELLDTYNNVKHEGIQQKPSEMDEKPLSQKMYIIKKIYQEHMRKKLSDLDLKPGTKVQFMVPREGNAKRPFQVSQSAVEILKRDGNSYIVAGEDGSVKTMERWRLFLAQENAPMLKSLGTNDGIIKKVVGGPKGNRYKVEWVMPAGSAPAFTEETKNTILAQVGGAKLLEQYEAQRKADQAQSRPITKELPAKPKKRKIQPEALSNSEPPPPPKPPKKKKDKILGPLRRSARLHPEIRNR
jgi:hypothetical protein